MDKKHGMKFKEKSLKENTIVDMEVLVDMEGREVLVDMEGREVLVKILRRSYEVLLTHLPRSYQQAHFFPMYFLKNTNSL